MATIGQLLDPQTLPAHARAFTRLSPAANPTTAAVRGLQPPPRSTPAAAAHILAEALTREWKTLTPDEKATWSEYATARHLKRPIAFAAYNQLSADQTPSALYPPSYPLFAPTRTYPATRTLPTPDITLAYISPERHTITLTPTSNHPDRIWGWVLAMRPDTATTPTHNDILQIHFTNGKPLTPITFTLHAFTQWQYWLHAFSADGKTSPAEPSETLWPDGSKIPLP